MYYSIIEAVPHEEKRTVVGVYNNSLLPHLQKVQGFQEETFFFAVNALGKGLTLAVWSDLEAIQTWRDEEHHLRIQAKGSETFESYRVRIGRELDETGPSESSEARHYATLYYTQLLEGSPLRDDVLGIIDNASVVSRLRNDLLESHAYQASNVLWLASWRSLTAMTLFQKSLKLSTNDKLVQLEVIRDYSKIHRRDAPHEIAGS